MFGFSLQKLMILVTIVAAVWYGFKLVQRLQEAREVQAREQGGVSARTAARRRKKGAGSGSDARAAEQMVQCPVCDTYVPARGTSNCGRPSCPY